MMPVKKLRFLLVPALLGALAIAAAAEPGAPCGPAGDGERVIQVPGQQPSPRIRGTVAAVLGGRRALSVTEDDDRRVTVLCTGRTKIRRVGRVIALRDIARGDRVTIRYERPGGAVEALYIAVQDRGDSR